MVAHADGNTSNFRLTVGALELNAMNRLKHVDPEIAKIAQAWSPRGESAKAGYVPASAPRSRRAGQTVPGLQFL